jgi:ferrochelatase
MDDIRPFLANVLRGRNVPAARVEEVAHHYELFGGVSPLTEYTRRQAAGLQRRLAASDRPLPVFLGMRNWHPLLPDTLSEMSRAGVRRAIGFIMAGHASYSSCQQYRENVLDARAAVRAAGLDDVEVTYVPAWYLHDDFIRANADQVRAALTRLPAATQDSARLVFTAHSIPVRMAEASKYEEQLLASSREIARLVGRSDWALVYQSRSGNPRDPWLAPDIGDYLRAARDEGLAAAVICPVGFVCDHIEVLYDLGHEAAGIASELGIFLTRAEAVNDHPRFLDMMADVVMTTIRRHATGTPLPILHRR